MSNDGEVESMIDVSSNINTDEENKRIINMISLESVQKFLSEYHQLNSTETINFSLLLSCVDIDQQIVRIGIARWLFYIIVSNFLIQNKSTLHICWKILK